MGLSASAAVYFIGALVLEDTLWSATDADLFFVSNAILFFTTTLYTVYTHDWRNRWRYLLYAVGAVLGVYLIAGVVNFFIAFNLAYVAVALVVIAVGTLFYLACANTSAATS